MPAMIRGLTRWLPIPCIMLFVLSCITCSRVAILEQNFGLLVGFARTNITPPTGYRLCGSFEEKISRGLHDSLYVRAMVFQQDSTILALVGCDLAMVHPGIGERVRSQVRHIGIRDDHVLIHASETHNGPDYFGEFRAVFHERAMRSQGYDPAEPIDYDSLLVSQITLAIEHAYRQLKPARLSFGQGKCEGIAFNRRFRMGDGSVGWNPGKLNPNIVKPLGPIDPELPVISIYQNDSELPTAILSSYALHLAIIEQEYAFGADYPYFLDQGIDSMYQKDVFSYFFQAPCCEVNHIDVSTSEPQSGFGYAEVVGKKLGHHVTHLVEDSSSEVVPTLKVASGWLDLSLQEFDESEIKQQRLIWHDPDRSDLPFLDVVHAGKVTGIYDRHDGAPIPALIQVVQFDQETALVGLPSEVSVELGLLLKERSPFSNTMIAQLSNDWFGYIPNRRIFDDGHYEAVVAKILPGEGERMIEFALDLLVQLR